MSIVCSECGEAAGGHRRAMDEVVQHEMVMERAAATVLALYQLLHHRGGLLPSWLERQAMQVHAELVRPQAEFEAIYHDLVILGQPRPGLYAGIAQEERRLLPASGDGVSNRPARSTLRVIPGGSDAL
ncbi:hypothetical protein JJC00_18645 [Bradyrhizobium diazoefficiens]|uniref:hypothetical protein n=1 Tax=Bradyrhizobium diazoefficiens TaxID=1355477 RepID=UPI00190BC669|nr:hypothetical protein [Bradyrhizobium diazoefficiens]QQO37448.1 hypothetical protein JJC00_18645 [Bradyrhizobium diazoefficiens]